MQFKTETKVGIFILVALGIFAYMAVYLGVFRIHLRNYKPYIIYFDDLSGLSKKADIKIAGVKVGWVDEIHLISDGIKARVKIMILGRYVLYDDAYAEVRQEGLLGSKYLELIPGTPVASDLPAGATLTKEGKSAISMEELLHKIRNIATNVETVTDSLKGAIGGTEHTEQLKSIVQNVQDATSKIAMFSHVLARNEQTVDTILQDMAKISHHIDEQLLPTFQKSIERISEAVDRDFSKVARGIEDTSKHIASIARKIDSGEGLLGKLVHDEQIYEDLRNVTHNICNATNTLTNMELIVDTHFESMYSPAEFYKHEDSKGYFDVRLHTSEDKFYLFELMGSEKGTLERQVTYNTYATPDMKLDQQDLNELGNAFTVSPYKNNQKKLYRDKMKFGFQFGKIFNDLALRFGLFESTFGVGIDYEVPFGNDNFRWISTFEIFDFRGRARLKDRRPHLKWLNRLYFMRNLYMVFGADDFVSRRNATAFFGAGVRFCDDDFKYLLGQLGGILGARIG